MLSGDGFLVEVFRLLDEGCESSAAERPPELLQELAIGVELQPLASSQGSLGPELVALLKL